MKKHPKVSILLLNWNGIEFTKKSIPDLLNLTYPNYEILVLDNGSDNNEAEKLEKLFGKKIKLFKNKKNVGYAAGINILFKYATGDFIMPVNNDMKFTKNFLQPLISLLLSDITIGACQPKVKDLKNEKYFEYAAAAGGYLDILGYPFARGRIFSKVEKDTGQYDNKVIVSWAGIILVRRNVLEKTWIFDEIFFNYSEDVDLCYRIYGKGYRIVFVPESVVFHYGGGVLSKNLGKKMFFIHRNHLILILKNWEAKTLAWLILPRILLDLVSFFYYLASGFPHSALAIVKAYFSLIWMLPRIYRARIKTQKKINRRYLSQMPIYSGSIVFDYFILKKRKFNKIIKTQQLYNSLSRK